MALQGRVRTAMTKPPVTAQPTGVGVFVAGARVLVVDGQVVPLPLVWK
jgi:hypothetical protein